MTCAADDTSPEGVAADGTAIGGTAPDGTAPDGPALDDAPLAAIALNDTAVVAAQLGRPPRSLRAVAHRCPCGLPDVIETAPRLDDGTPFPTLYYLTCPRAVAAVSRLESGGVMKEMERALHTDPGVRRGYLSAHLDYLSRRDQAARASGLEPLPAGMQSAGGMPGRVKCLHALIAHALAVPGVNPLGSQAAVAAGPWWARGPCVAAPPQ